PAYLFHHAANGRVYAVVYPFYVDSVDAVKILLRGILYIAYMSYASVIDQDIYLRPVFGYLIKDSVYLLLVTHIASIEITTAIGLFDFIAYRTARLFIILQDTNVRAGGGKFFRQRTPNTAAPTRYNYCFTVKLNIHDFSAYS